MGGEDKEVGAKKSVFIYDIMAKKNKSNCLQLASMPYRKLDF